MYKITLEGNSYEVLVEEATGEVAAVKEVKTTDQQPAPAVEVTALLSGNVYELFCAAGQKVKKGETLLILEAMKMETPVASPEDGTITSLEVVIGQTVQAGQVIALLEVHP
jgi:pyruvate carboxylase subunit B